VLFDAVGMSLFFFLGVLVVGEGERGLGLGLGLDSGHQLGCWKG
jgi:hypothetical protein